MQKLVLPFTVFLALVLGSLTIYQHLELRALVAKVASLEKAASLRDAATNQNRDKTAKLEAENEAFTDESAALRKKLAEQAATEAQAADSPLPMPPAATPAKAAGNPFAGMMNKMMADPKMRATVIAQQMMVMKPMYADLVKQLHLSPAETDQFFALLAQQAEEGMTAGMKMLSGDKGAVADLKNPPLAGKEEMKTLLGDAGYQQYEAYQKSIPDRTMLTQVNSQMASRQLPLRPDQSAGLLQIMQQEQLNTSRFASTTTSSNDPNNLELGAIQNTLAAQQERSARIVARSKLVLTPEQFNAFSDQQKQALEMQKMGLEMAQGMFATPEK